jgi:hypothetical protein
MRTLRALLIAALLIPAYPVLGATPGDDDDGWMSFGHALSLVQVLVRIAGNPGEQQKAFDDVLAGNNAEANRALAGLFEEMTSDMPAEYKDKVASIGRDLGALARKQGISPGRTAAGDPLQARKDLTAMGLRYHDPKDFLEAVKRDDLLAVELFIAGRGVNLSSKDAEGRTAADIARANNNAQMGELLARNLPPKR